MSVSRLCAGLAVAAMLAGAASTTGSSVAVTAVGTSPQLGPFELVPVPGGLSGTAYDARLSGDGRYVAFSTWYTRRERLQQAWVWDRQTSTTTLVSATPTSEPGAGRSRSRAITPDGRYVLFTSSASDLVSGDTNGRNDVFVRDLATATTTRVSVTSSGGQLGRGSEANSLTADAHVAFFATPASGVHRDHNGVWDVYAHNLITGRTTLVSQNSRGQPGNRNSFYGLASDNGTMVAFQSYSTNMARGDNDDTESVFFRNRTTGRTKLVSVRPDGTSLAVDSLGGISGDGRIVAFNAEASGPHERGWVYQRDTGRARAALPGPTGIDAALFLYSFRGNLLAVQSEQDLTNEENNPDETEDVYALRLSSGELTWLTVQDPPSGFPLWLVQLSRTGNTLLVTTYGSLVDEDTGTSLDLYLRDIAW